MWATIIIASQGSNTDKEEKFNTFCLVELHNIVHLGTLYTPLQMPLFSASWKSRQQSLAECRKTYKLAPILFTWWISTTQLSVFTILQSFHIQKKSTKLEGRAEHMHTKSFTNVLADIKTNICADESATNLQEHRSYCFYEHNFFLIEKRKKTNFHKMCVEMLIASGKQDLKRSLGKIWSKSAPLSVLHKVSVKHGQLAWHQKVHNDNSRFYSTVTTGTEKRLQYYMRDSAKTPLLNFGVFQQAPQKDNKYNEQQNLFQNKFKVTKQYSNQSHRIDSEK